MPASAPVLLLRERQGERRVLPIYIGRAEAAAIHVEMSGQRPARPLPHDLFGTFFENLDIQVTRIAIVDIDNGTFYAEMDLMQGRKATRISLRPSDAVAIAVRLGTSIEVEEGVMDAAALPDEMPQDEAADDGLLEDFRRFIDEVSPEDFSGDQS
ncbi:MAG: bifunctional nuclease family protein [Acidimicrobiales bacterium]